MNTRSFFKSVVLLCLAPLSILAKPKELIPSPHFKLGQGYFWKNNLTVEQIRELYKRQDYYFDKWDKLNLTEIRNFEHYERFFIKTGYWKITVARRKSNGK